MFDTKETWKTLTSGLSGPVAGVGGPMGAQMRPPMGAPGGRGYGRGYWSQKKLVSNFVIFFRNCPFWLVLSENKKKC